MGKSIIRMQHDRIPIFLLAMPDSVVVRSASVDPDDRNNLLLLISGRGVPGVKEVEAIVKTEVIDGQLNRWIEFVEATPPSPILMPNRKLVLNG